MVAGGLYGIRREWSLPEPFIGNATESGLALAPESLAEARARFGGSDVVRELFARDGLEHLVRAAAAALAAFTASVPAWERVRGFERL
jgi:glutamine synthetase